jgi:hypothetical protein
MKRVEIGIFGKKFSFTATDTEADSLFEHATAANTKNKAIQAAADILEAAGVPLSKLRPLVASVETICVQGITISPIESDGVEVLSHRLANPDGTMTDVYVKQSDFKEPA